MLVNKINLSLIAFSALQFYSAAVVAEQSFISTDIPAIDCMIEPNVMVELSSAVAGVLDTLTVDKSDQVKKGQVIATLKSDIEQVNVRSSTMNLIKKKSPYLKNLMQSGLLGI